MTPPAFVGKAGLAKAAATLFLVTGWTVAAGAQAIERNLPITPQGGPGRAVVRPETPSSENAEPLGASLRAIVLLGANEKLHSRPPAGVSIGRIRRLDDHDASDTIADRLARYLRQPISLKLISQIEADIAGYYRQQNYPFVSLSAPEQEIDRGVLQIRVIEFKAGSVAVKGVSHEDAVKLRGRIGLQPGETINSRELSDDLYWINRYPFRQLQAVFSPGKATGTSDLTLEATTGRPWRVYGGYNNYGSPSTGLDRYYAGGAIGGVLGADSVLSVQGTWSPDWWAGARFPHYRSVAANYVVPVGARGQIEAAADVVKTGQVVDPFAVDQMVVEGSVSYRHSIPTFRGMDGIADARAGVELKHQTGNTYFGGARVIAASMDVVQLYAALHYAADDTPTQDNIDIALHVSPGNIGGGNSSDQALLFSRGRLDTMTYAYLSLGYSRWTPLLFGLRLKSQIIAQYSAAALPSSVQQGLGGTSLVRGYTLDNGGFDSIAVVRNELHAKDFGVAGFVGFSPYVFSDFGYGHDNFLHQSDSLGSVGVGTSAMLKQNLTLNVDVANALVANRAVRSGAWSVLVNVTAAF